MVIESYTIPCSSENLSKIRHFMEAKLQALPLSDTDKFKIILAVDEACANAIIHGNKCNAHHILQVRFAAFANYIQVDICDTGKIAPKNQTPPTEPNITDFTEKRQRGGLGLSLIHHIMDKVTYYPKGKQTVCTLVKNLPAA